MREQALPVDNFTIQVKACELSLAFCAKGETAQTSSIQRFMKKNGYIYRFEPQTAQRDPKETFAKATDFMKMHLALLDEPVGDKRNDNVLKNCCTF